MKKTLLALVFSLLASTALAGTGSESDKAALDSAKATATPDQLRKIDSALRRMSSPRQFEVELPSQNYGLAVSAYGSETSSKTPTSTTKAVYDKPSRYIVVNIPSFSAYVVENDRVVLTTRVIVGKGTSEATKTPEMTTTMTHVVWNPYWAPPFRYDREKTISGWRNNPSYLRNNQLSVIRNIDHSFVPEHELTESIFRSPEHTIVQTPGEGNMLGKALFLLHNPHDVYMHDTNNRHLFDNAKRNFSLGCIRVQEWLRLASWALGRSESQIQSEIGTGIMAFNQLSSNIPVFVVYWLADVVDGEVVFYNDLYNWVK